MVDVDELDSDPRWQQSMINKIQKSTSKDEAKKWNAVSQPNTD